MKINPESPSAKYIVFALSWPLFVICVGFNVTSVAMLLPRWEKLMGWGSMEYGLIVGAISMGFVCSVLAAGILIDKFNYQTVALAAAFANAAAALLKGWFSDFPTAYAALFLTGVTASGVYSGSIKMINVWFDRRHTLKANAILLSGSALGYILGFLFTIPLTDALGGWDGLFALQAVLTALFAAVILVAVPLRTEAQGAMNADLGVEVKEYTVLRRIQDLGRSRQFLLVMASEFFISGAILTFSSMGPKFFPSYWEGLESTTLGVMMAATNAGSCFGYFLLPPLADRFGYRKRFVVPAVIWVCAFFAISPLTHSPLYSGMLNFVGSFANGLAVSGGRTLMLEHKDVAGIKAGTASGMLLTSNRLGCVALPLIFMFMFDRLSHYAAWASTFAIGTLGVIPLLFVEDTGWKARKKREGEGRR
ncbi:MAG: MFS transporter [Clostridiales Family XIII bacterium]|nr:MFS transporter [Clostridiales Family XIII bacterium]